MHLQIKNEPSTWRGLVILLTGLGIPLSPELQEVIISCGLFVAGLIGVVFPDDR